MISYFDTSVLMCIADPSQEAHVESLAAYKSAIATGRTVTTTLHAYAELYTNLTKVGGGRPGLSPEVAAFTIITGIGESFETVELSKDDYVAAIERVAKLKLPRAIIYDALHFQAAVKVGASVLYTDNLKDFVRLKMDDDDIEIKGVRTK